MNINKIKLKNFRNYTEQEIELDPHINVFYGDNAQGKTNILEAIFISGFGKSFRTSKEKEMIKLGEDFLETNIFYDKSDRSGKIKIIIADKKQIEVNGVKIKKLSELIGNLNLVIFTPDDIQILKNGPAESGEELLFFNNSFTFSVGLTTVFSSLSISSSICFFLIKNA